MSTQFTAEYFNLKAEGYTHLEYTKGKELKIKNGKYADFINDYINRYDNNELGDVCIGEKVPEEPPIIVSMEFNYPQDDGNEIRQPYKLNFINDLVLSTQTVIEGLLTASESVADIKVTTCAVVITSPYKVVEHNCFAVTLYFPSIRMLVSDQKKILRPKLVAAYKRDNIQYGLSVAVSGDISSFLLSDSLNDCYPLLGSVKKAKHSPEQQILYFNEKTKEIDQASALSLWSPLNHIDVVRYNMPIIEAKVYLAIILSCRYQGSTILEFGDEDEVAMDQVIAQERPEEQICRTMLLMIDMNTRMKNVVFRTIIGKSIYNIYPKEKELGFNLWFQHCKKVLGEAAVEEEYREIYENFSSKNYYSEITLQTFAKEDNEREYKKWDRETLKPLLLECLDNLNHGVYSRALFHIYKLSHTYISHGKRTSGTWYIHNGAYLESISMEDPGMDILRDQIKLFANLSSADKSERGQAEALGKCRKAMDYMDKVGTLSGIGKFLKLAFAKRTYRVKLNENQNIFCASNLVLESTRSKEGMVERRGLVEDYFTFHSTIPYVNSLTEKHPYVVKERDFSYKIYGAKDKVIYMDSRRSRCMVGSNNEKSLTLKIGQPNAGKTTDTKIRKMQFGDYLFSGNTTMLTGAKGSSSNATPDTAHTDNKRDIEFDDPDTPTNGVLNEGWLCQEVGGSNRHTRFTFEDGSDHEATAEYSISTNDLKFNPSQQLIIRIVVIMYNAKTLDEDDEKVTGVAVPDSEEGQRSKNIYRKKNFSEKDYREMAIARLWRDVKNHSSIDWNRNTPKPDIILKDTKRWWEKSDPYHRFVKEHIRLDPSQSTSLHGNTLYQCYSIWFKSNNPNMAMHDMFNFNRCMKGVIGEPDDDDTYIRYKLYDRKFIDFVESIYDIVEDRNLHITAAEAYEEYKSWQRATNMSKMNKDYYSFIAYMSSSCVNYDETVKGFRGLVRRQNRGLESTD